MSSSDILDKITSRTAKVCVIGLGYVGIPLSVASAEAGFTVVGVDVDREKVAKTNSGICYVEDKYSEQLLSGFVQSRKLRATPDIHQGAYDADIIIICVPTPLDAKGQPNLAYLRSVGKDLSKFLDRFKLVILESTSFPGTTQEVLQPLLERDGKRAARDFALVYSPERIDYGNPQYSVKTITKLVGGVDPVSTKLGAAFYRGVLHASVVEVSGPSVAEAAKMLENIFRYVNIALVNELSILHEKLGVDFIEAIGAAATKPFGFMAHYPGPGIGGHCIPKDPFYLVYMARKVGFPMRLVSAASVVNKMMPRHIVDRTFQSLKEAGKSPSRSTVVIWGLSYKGEVKDTRRSPALEVLKLFMKTRVLARVYDPFVPEVLVAGKSFASATSMEESVRDADCIIITTNHNEFRTAPLKTLLPIMRQKPFIYDTRNTFAPARCEEAGFTYVGLGRS